MTNTGNLEIILTTAESTDARDQLENASPLQCYRGHEAEILMTRYKEQAQHLRHLDLFDIRVAGGFLAFQLALSSWFAGRPLPTTWAALALIVIDFALLVVCVMIVRSSRDRRDEIVQTIRNINAALGLVQPHVYGVAHPINPTRKRSRFYWYEIGCLVGFLGTALIIFGSTQPSKTTPNPPVSFGNP